MAGTRAGAQMQAAYGTGATAVMQQSADKGRQLAWFRPSSIPRSCMARKCGLTEGGQDKMSAVVSSPFGPTHPRGLLF
jgi:hypothetical protein